MFYRAVYAGVLSLGFILTTARGGTTWDGGGATARWSDPANWDPDGVPPALAPVTLTSAGSSNSIQDIASPFELASLTFASPHVVGGSPLRVLGNVNVTNDASFGNAVRGGIDFPAGGTITTPAAQGVGRVLELTNTSGAGVLNVNGAVMLQGDTTFAGPVNAAGRLVTLGHVTAPQTYTVSGGEFFGAGVMTFAPGARLDVTGRLAPGIAALPFDFGDLRVEGDVRLRGTLEIELLTIPPVRSDHLDVTGTFDAQGSLSLIADPRPGQYLIGSYGNRVGTLAFDRPGISLVYTSAEHAGPGQMYIVVPEPAGAVAAIVVGAWGAARRRPRPCAATMRT